MLSRPRLNWLVNKLQHPTPDINSSHLITPFQQKQHCISHLRTGWTVTVPPVTVLRSSCALSL